MSEEQTSWRQQRTKRINDLATKHNKEIKLVEELYAGHSQMGEAYFLFRAPIYSDEVQNYAYALTDAYFERNRLLEERIQSYKPVKSRKGLFGRKR